MPPCITPDFKNDNLRRTHHPCRQRKHREPLETQILLRQSEEIMTTRLIQIQQGSVRQVGLIDEPKIRLLAEFASIYELANAAINKGMKLSALVRQCLTDESLDYDDVYAGASEWRILPAVDHPEEPARCLVTGTGLTHTASAKNRNAMHAESGGLTDSIRMFQSGLEGGRPEDGKIGVAPEWFYKGCGMVLRAHGEPLIVPTYAEDGGEEPEVAGVYLIGPDAQPYRIGFTIGNEFSDHQFEQRNYLYLAGSKLRNCAVGPELVIDHKFESVPGVVTIERDGHTLWSHEIKTGDAEMCHSLRNIEHHHFKFAGHRRPGDVHVHFFGADAFSFGAGVWLNDGDVMNVRFEGFGRALSNPVRMDRASDVVVAVTTLT
ncbi:MAG: GguC protein [Acidobacteriota bacterium]|nr:GguC protein [Acidobacteriota bacterium]